MSTKYFRFEGGAAAALAGETYTAKAGGNPIEFTIIEAQMLAVLGWHALTDPQRAGIVSRLAAIGYVEDVETKPEQKRV